MPINVGKPLADLQTDYYTQLKSDLYDYITKTSNFPGWKQTNYADTFSELSIKKLTSSISTTEQTTLDNIVAIRSWKNNLLTERDRVKALVFAATSVADIRTAIDSFTYTPPPFPI